MQKTLPLTGTLRRRLVTLSETDRAFIESMPINDVPDSIWCETRAQRIGCSVSEIMCMRSYDRAREIAEEVAMYALGLDHFETAQPYRPDDALLDAIAKRERLERAAEFQEFLKSRKVK